MKTAGKVATAVAVLLAAPLLLAAFVPNEYVVERHITINRPRQEVFSYVRQLRNQDHFNKWAMQDPQMQKTYRGTDGEVGFVYGWNGNDQAGEGEQEIRQITEGRRMVVEVRFKRPFAGVAQIPFSTEVLAANQTRLTWGMEGRHPYPLNIMNLFMDAALGKDLEQSLHTLKTILENQSLTQSTI